MKKIIIKALLFFYFKISKVQLIRDLLKKLLKGSHIEKTVEGIKINVSSDISLEQMLLFEEYNEYEILKLIDFYSKKDYTFIDIGANIGLHSLVAAKNQNISVFSFEPEPNNFNSFLSNIALNGFKNIKPLNIGLGNENTSLHLNVNEGWNKGKHSLKVDFGNKTVKIPVLKLDVMSNYFNGAKLFIKLDVEGFEREVLLGAEEVLKNEEIVLTIELLEETSGKEECLKIFELLSENGFTPKIISNEKGMNTCTEYTSSGDYIFAKGEGSLELLKKAI